MSKRKSFDMSFKLKAVEYAESKSKQAAVRKFAFDTKRIRVWCSLKDELVVLKNSGMSKKIVVTGCYL